MLKKTIITYYAVWYLAHKNSKHAKDFRHYWYHAFLQVAESVFAFAMVVLVLIEGLFGTRLVDLGKYAFILVFMQRTTGGYFTKGNRLKMDRLPPFNI